MMYSRSIGGARGELCAAARARARRALPACRRVIDAHDAIIGAQFHLAGDQVERALVGVAFLEQHAAGAQFANLGLAGERVQVLGLQSVERRESLQNREIERSFIHREIRRRLGYNPMILAANPTIRAASVRPRSGSQSTAVTEQLACQPASGRKRSP